jgi:chitinase
LPASSFGRKITSFLRSLVVLGVVGAGIAAGAVWFMDGVPKLTAEEPTVWVAPYVDTTLTPTHHFEEASESPATDVVLGFIVADNTDPCRPSWGTYYDLEAAARALDLDRRVVRTRERGSDVVVSFGGAVNNELAVVCKDVDKLAAAYQAVVDRYQLRIIDFDVEGAAVADTAANERRTAAIKKLQGADPDLRVWYTLPVSPEGLTREGVALVDGILASTIDLTGINVMTMDYGASRPASMSMREATKRALEATWAQLDISFRRAGMTRTEREVWGLVGATPMIGQNDVPSEIFSIADAEWLSAFAREKHMGRLSIWSANRDAQCGTGSDGNRVSNTCSGVEQSAGEFTRTLSAGGSVSSTDLIGEPPVVISENPTRAQQQALDDPRTSPYPMWRSTRVYLEGNKVGRTVSTRRSGGRKVTSPTSPSRTHGIRRGATSAPSSKATVKQSRHL